MMKNLDTELRSHLLTLLDGEDAHISFNNAVQGFPEDLINRKTESLDHTAWGLLYHMNISLWDILEFIRNPSHQSPEYPHGLWPEQSEADAETWRETIASFNANLKSMKSLISDTSRDLLAPLPHGTGQTLMRETLVIADHNAYHVGQFVQLRMFLGVPVKDY